MIIMIIIIIIIMMMMMMMIIIITDNYRAGLQGSRYLIGGMKKER